MCRNQVSIPVIADDETGHGDLHNVQRTVECFESAGAAGILLEDQVAPKRCGHFAEKQVIQRSLKSPFASNSIGNGADSGIKSDR